MVEPKKITEEIFLNKELCDSIRELVVKHTFSVDEAINILRHSKKYSRDVEIAGKLCDVGFSKTKIEHIIIIMNTL